VAQLTDRIRIERPVEVVFDFIADSRSEPTYNPDMRSVTLLTGEPMGTGTRFRATMGRGGPRWLSGWGIAGTTLGLTAALLVLFGFTAPLSTLQVALNLPFFVNEMVLAVWLIVKGFAALPVAGDQAGTSAPLPVLQMSSTS
jgi:hypothetical protein